MRKLLLGLPIALAGLLALPATASADITAFFGVGHRPETRTVKGAAVGLSIIAVGFEVEYADFAEKDEGDTAAPRLRTGMVNAIVQTPTSGAQLYATAGVGLYRENFRLDWQETNTAINIGGGLKMGLMGPVKLRVDYRFFALRGNPIEKSVHRVYAGLNASF
jgi:opacity protein-like surface antigen